MCMKLDFLIKEQIPYWKSGIGYKVNVIEDGVICSLFQYDSTFRKGQWRIAFKMKDKKSVNKPTDGFHIFTNLKAANEFWKAVVLSAKFENGTSMNNQYRSGHTLVLQKVQYEQALYKGHTYNVGRKMDDIKCITVRRLKILETIKSLRKK